MKSLKNSNICKELQDHPSVNECLIFDLETDSLITDQANIKFAGFYSYKYKKYFICYQHEHDKISTLINEHKILIGFNNKDFDCPILEHNGYDLQYKIIFDCMRVLYNPEMRKNNRKTVIQLHNGNSLDAETSSNSLRSIAKALNLTHHKDDIDYKIFQKNSWTNEELEQIEKYLYMDIATTKELFEFYVSYFDHFKKYVSEDNIRKFNYIRSSLGSYTYSAICHLAGLDESKAYNDNFKKRETFKGAYVRPIHREYTSGNIVCLDFASLYPHTFIQCNLYSEVDYLSCPVWHGDNFFPVKGYYACRNPGKIESLLKNILETRLELKKKKDPHQLPLKIVLNTAYGITGNPNFLYVHSKHNAEDCTQIGVTCAKYAHQIFEENGYEVLYGDTDSAFVNIPNNKSLPELLELCDQIIKDLQSHMPFPTDTWKLALDSEIQKIWLFNKKCYIYLTKRDKLVIKGITIIKSDASELGQKILEIIKPLIVERKNIKFSKEYFEHLIHTLIQDDISLIGQLYSVRNPEKYDSKSSLQFQIANVLGEGNHLLIPNKRLGTIGKVKKYCTKEEAKQLTLNDLILEKVWTELAPFITIKEEQMCLQK